MGNAVKIGDIGTAHGNHPPTSITAGSGTVKVDNMPLARQGDAVSYGRTVNVG